MNTEFEQLQAQLKTLGFDEAKIKELVDIATEEAIDTTLDSLTETLNDQELESLTDEINKPYDTPEQAAERIELIFTKAYGDNAENKKFELVNKYLKDVIDITNKSQDLLQRYQQGDPTAVATIQSHKDDPDVKEVQDAMEDSME